MQCKPILFNSQMVRAILEGHKTVTRRLIKPRYRDDESGFQVITNAHTGEFVRVEKVSDQGCGIFPDGSERFVAPPCWPGDILYVRETWSFWPCYDCDNEMCYGRGTNYKDTDGCFVYKDQTSKVPYNERWSPSIHMPKVAARLFLKVTGVRAERLKDITIEDIRREGIRLTPREEMCGCDWETVGCREQPCSNRDAYLPAMYISKFAGLWDSTIQEDNYLTDSYSANPWVWVIEFERCEKPKERM